MEEGKKARNENVPPTHYGLYSNECLKCEKYFTFRCQDGDDYRVRRICPNCKNINRNATEGGLPIESVVY